MSGLYTLPTMVPHYFALYSRLGLQYAPIGSDELNIGVEDGPNAILDESFIRKYPGKISEYIFPQPIVAEQYWELVHTHSIAASDWISDQLQSHETQICIGGDHSITFASLHALARRIDLKTVAYLQIDSHPDLNTVQSSPSGNFHGMYVRAAVGAIGIPVIDAVFKQKLPTQNLWYFGNLSFDPDPEERLFLNNHHIPTTSVSQLRSDWNEIGSNLEKFLRNFSHVHVSFDIDCMDATIAPATGIPCPDGFLLNDIQLLVQKIKSTAHTMSIDLVEVNPHKFGAQQTINTAQEILNCVLE